MVSEVILFFLKAVGVQVFLYLCYHVLFRNRAHHMLNRLFLVTALLISLVIPFIENPTGGKLEIATHMEQVVTHWVASPINNENAAESLSGHTYSGYVVFFLYFLMLAVLVARSVYSLYQLQQIKKQSEYVGKVKFRLYKTIQSRPFSFLFNVFIPEKLFGSKSFQPVLAHENEHVRQLHSFDRLLVDFMVALFWFNPFIYLYRKALIEIHEFQADAAVVSQLNDPLGYQEILYQQLQPMAQTDLVSHFNFSTIKKRIVMMNKSNKRTAKGIYLLSFPVLAVVLMAFTSDQGEITVSGIADKIESISIPERPRASQPELDKNGVPSILPLQAGTKFRVTSSYGMRTHPQSGKKRMHKGIDLACPVGTPVLATANGRVMQIVENKDSFGKKIILEHNEGFRTVYTQLSSFSVQQGDKVKQGQVIALSGNSGASTGPHLHYEVIKDGKNVDPMAYINNYEFTPKRGAMYDSLSEEEKEALLLAMEEVERAKKELEAAKPEIENAKAELERAQAEIAVAKEEMERAKEEMAVAKKELHNIDMEKVRRKIEKETKKMQEELTRMEKEFEKMSREGEVIIKKEKDN